MIDVALSILFIVMAYRIATGVMRQSAVFAEFNQSRALGVLALLFPLGPVALLILGARLPEVAFVVAAACYVPGFLVARAHRLAFERAGTDRVQGAITVSTQAFGTALVGLLLVALHLTYYLAVRFLPNMTDA